ncbi:TVP38/TMEM64 family protein [Aliidiomarina iranensis]|nr:TVP38/TMEM64 family protein [Aliidiomarina iranensis]
MKRKENSKTALWLFIGFLSVLVLLALIWRFAWNTNVLSVEQAQSALAMASSWHGELWLWPLITAVFVVLLLVMFPLTILVVLTGFLYGPWWGFCYATLGTLASSIVSYEVGRLSGQRVLLRFGGKRLQSISRFMGERGVRTMIIINLLPIAPFTLTNVMAGASHIRFRPYLLGSAIGIIPGLALVNFAGSELSKVMQGTDGRSIALSIFILAAITFIIIFGPRWLRRKLQQNEKEKFKPPKNKP